MNIRLTHEGLFQILAAWRIIQASFDPEIRAGMEAAVLKNLIPAATERVYPGHFTINADGGGYGRDTTWPGLDPWQMAGPYLQLGRTRLVLDYFEFVRASQRKDGNIPFAIFKGNTRPGGCLRGLDYPDDLFTYKPPRQDPAGNGRSRGRPDRGGGTGAPALDGGRPGRPSEERSDEAGSSRPFASGDDAFGKTDRRASAARKTQGRANQSP